VRLPRLGQSPVAALASADLRHEVPPGHLRLPRLCMSHRVSCTNACTNQPPWAYPRLLIQSGHAAGMIHCHDERQLSEGTGRPTEAVPLLDQHATRPYSQDVKCVSHALRLALLPHPVHGHLMVNPSGVPS
jgi:hypothetical protein